VADSEQGDDKFLFYDIAGWSNRSIYVVLLLGCSAQRRWKLLPLSPWEEASGSKCKGAYFEL
jgi:hypothetical protein